MYVYIMASVNRVLYVGVTKSLAHRIEQHKVGTGSKFCRQYRINRLVYFEEHDGPTAALVREKQVKGWRREKKLALIEEGNPFWEDLSESL
jgi:putative endonuclease